MDLNFEVFMVVLLILSILVVGNFLRDEKSNYLEGSLLIVCLDCVTCRILSTELMRGFGRSCTPSLRLRLGSIPMERRRAAVHSTKRTIRQKAVLEMLQGWW